MPVVYDIEQNNVSEMDEKSIEHNEIDPLSVSKKVWGYYFTGKRGKVIELTVDQTREQED